MNNNNNYNNHKSNHLEEDLREEKLKTPDSSMTIKSPLSDITYNNTNDNQVYVEAPPLPFHHQIICPIHYHQKNPH